MIALSQPRVQFDREVVPTLPAGFDIINGHLFHQGLDLTTIVDRPIAVQGRIEKAVTPAYVRYLPALRNNYNDLNDWFHHAQIYTDYAGKLTVAYASKANPSASVVSTLLQMGAAYECSSNYDVEIVRQALACGWLDPQRLILSNGFKIPSYTRNLLQLRAEGFANLLPIFDDLDEIAPFAESGFTFDVGLRSRTDANYLNRFGLNADELVEAAQQIAATSTLRLTTFHAMQTISASRGLPYQTALGHSLRSYAELYRIAPTLHIFDLGGGLPGRSSDMDFQDWMIQTLQTIQRVCEEEAIPVPDLLVESGRFLVQDHASKMFRVLKSKMADDGIPFYVIDGSIMSNFPDAWALGDTFTILPLNNWDGPFQQVRLSGLTCDPDDIYPTHRMADVPLLLPENTDGLLIGFFDCGAYQETLGGRHGAKHCLLPEGAELVFDETNNGIECCDFIGSQVAEQVLNKLGYHCH